MIIDRFNFGRLHPVLNWSVPIYTITQMLRIGLMPSIDIARALVFGF
jgi:hypothetical protein